MRIPGTLCVIWLVRPCPMKPAPTMPTRIGFPSASRAFSALSTMIIGHLRSLGRRAHRCAHAPSQLGLDLGERLPSGVLRGDFRDRERPCESETRIVVKQSAL